MKLTVFDKLVYRLSKRTAGKMFTEKLSDILPQDTISKLPEEIWSEYRQGLTHLEKKETLGANLVIRFSLLTLIFYNKLIAENVEKQEAIRRTAEITWAIYEKLTDKFWFVTRLFSKKAIERVKKAIVFSIKHFPYNRPGYEMEIIKTSDDEIAYNVYKCPAAEFFREHQLSELCAGTWCDLDYSLAEKWNVKLEREKTIAKGDEICAFRFISTDKEER